MCIRDRSSDVVKLVKYSGSLYFANAPFFETQMLEIIAKNKDQLKYIVVDVGALNQIDASGEAVLSELVESCSTAGIEILFARTERLEVELFRSGFKKRFGEDRFFNRTAQALKHVWEELESDEKDKGKVINIS